MYETKVNSPKGKLQCKFVSAQASHPRNFKGSKKQKQYDKTKKKLTSPHLWYMFISTYTAEEQKIV